MSDQERAGSLAIGGGAVVVGFALPFLLGGGTAAGGTGTIVGGGGAAAETSALATVVKMVGELAAGILVWLGLGSQPEKPQN